MNEALQETLTSFILLQNQSIEKIKEMESNLNMNILSFKITL
jgi:hypothetical protein